MKSDVDGVLAGSRYDATIRAAAESDGVIPDAVKVEAMARAMDAKWKEDICDPWAGDAEWLTGATELAQAALNALRALEGE